MREIARKYAEYKKKTKRKHDISDEVNSISGLAKIWTRKENDCYVARVQNDGSGNEK
jgi:hypothetical protein